MSVIQWAMLAVAIPTAMAYACRLGALDSRRHRRSAILWHLALGCAAVWSAGQAVTGPTPLDATLLAASTFWIIASYSDWRDAVPHSVARTDASWWHHAHPLD